MIYFHLPIIPPKATSQGAGKRIVIVRGKPMFFKNHKAQSAENDLTLLCAPHRPERPFVGPVSLHIDVVFPWRKNEPKRRLAMGRVPHTTRPDASNIVKMIEDVLTKLVFWDDDSQVADLRVTKAWGDRVGITVSIAPLDMLGTPVEPKTCKQPSLF